MIEIYSKDQCPNCDKAKNLLKTREIPWEEKVIGRDIDRELFLSTYPGVRSVPFITENGEPLGGLNELQMKLMEI